MQEVKGSQQKLEFYAVISLIFITIIISALLFLDINKHKVINLNTADIKVVDDRAVLGASIATVVKTNHGLKFSCQISNSHLDQPYCELIVNLQDLSKQKPFTGLDLSNYQQIGLWIEHSHPTQPGTRIELRNFNSSYSTQQNKEVLKPNTLEYLEAYVTNPVWLKLTDFSIPQWWNNSHNLTLNNGGTDFSNIYSIAIAPSKKVQQGSYQITIERIELQGKYIGETTLITLLIMLWSIAVGYIIRRLVTAQKVLIDTPEQTSHPLEFGAMSCPLTGALNRIGLRKCFDQLTPSDLHKLSIIFINIDYFEDLYPNYGQQTADKILQQFVNNIDKTCRSSDTVARWNNEEFLLVCPDTELSQALDVANKIRVTMQEASWPDDIKITCSSGVAQMYDEDLNDLIARANKALYKAKITGSNKTAAA